jgi:phenylacetate-CoA ligase
MKVWNRKYELINEKELRKLQLSRLKNTVNKFPNLKKIKINSLKDIKKLPFMSKNDLVNNGYSNFKVDMDKVVRIHSSSGTTNKPIIVGYTKTDLDTWSDLTARVLVGGGASSKDIIQIAFRYALFTGGFGLHYGAEKLGATVIPTSNGQSKRQVKIMKEMGVTTLLSTPSYALHLSETCDSEGIDKSKLNLKYGLFGSEFWTEQMRKEIEEQFRIVATDNYGLTEVIGPGVAYECLNKNGLHVAEDHFIVEVVDPKTGETVEEGEKGELVFTSLTKDCFPVVRFRTRDISRLIKDKCECGRTLVRIEKITGRSDDMLSIRGFKLFPSQVESILLNMDGIAPQYKIVLDRNSYLDKIMIFAETEKDLGRDIKRVKTMEHTMKTKFRNILGIKVGFRLLRPGVLQRTEGKAKRVVDKREFFKSFK